MGIIRVQGRSERTVEFDRMRLVIEFELRGPDVGALSRTVDRDVEELLTALADSGISASDVRVDAERSRFEPYPEPGTSVYTKSLSISRALDRVELNALIETIASTTPNARHSVEYSYAGEASLDLELIGEAVSDARARAGAIARALGEDLGPVEKVDLTGPGYGPAPRMMALSESAMDMGGRQAKQADDLSAGEVTFTKELVAEWFVGERSEEAK